MWNIYPENIYNFPVTNIFVVAQPLGQLIWASSWEQSAWQEVPASLLAGSEHSCSGTDILAATNCLNQSYSLQENKRKSIDRFCGSNNFNAYNILS